MFVGRCLLSAADWCVSLAGDCGKFGTQWCCYHRVEDVVAELEELRDVLPRDLQVSLVELLHKMLFKQTATMSLSLALANAVAAVPQAFGSLGVQRRPVESAGKSRRAAKREARSPSATPEGKQQRTTEKKKKTTGWDVGSPKGGKAVDGVKGPNKLLRMKGGNPAGDPCGRLKSTGTCPFETCSFSHD